DHHRALRRGAGEVIFGEGKTPEQIAILFERLAAGGGNVLATRVSSDAAELVRRKIQNAEYHATCRALALIQSASEAPILPHAAVCSAGTADIPVADEAAVTLEFLGVPLRKYYDVGVAGLHRLVASIQEIRQAAAVIVVAGMEGALPSVVAGMVAT